MREIERERRDKIENAIFVYSTLACLSLGDRTRISAAMDKPTPSHQIGREYSSPEDFTISLCTAVHVIISFCSSFPLLCFLFPFNGIAKARLDAKT